MSDGDVKGVELESVSVSSGPSNVNVYVYDDLPANETERRQGMVRQINELRYALLGDSKYGVDGMVDTVRKIWIWLYVLSVLLAIVALILLYQQFQIYQMIQRLG